ncbi:MAG: acyl-CoA reductase [Owenweeksia sp.]
MFDLADRISAFGLLGQFLGQYEKENNADELKKLNQFFLAGLRENIQQAGIYNNWFTRDNTEFALQQWSEALSAQNLEAWTQRYPADHFNQDPRTIAIIMAGNIPMVGFHDLLSVLLSGHKALIKPSGDDKILIPFICQVLVAIDRRFASRITLADGRLTGFDAIIATGSNNSSRYFDHYFSKYPHVIRKNRTSVAMLNGNETEAQLKNLSEDIFRYFGLGCRNVSKLYLPEGFDLDRLFKAFFQHKEVIDNKKYGNNYDYNRAIYMMERQAFLENGFMILKESTKLHAPASVVYYEFYADEKELVEKKETLSSQLQCVVGNPELDLCEAGFGQAQKPKLWDYADKVDILKFLRTV